MEYLLGALIIRRAYCSVHPGIDRIARLFMIFS
jgi:hypothetical protein